MHVNHSIKNYEATKTKFVLTKNLWRIFAERGHNLQQVT